ncbi:MAG: hypothetical protein Kow00129_10440 [Thermoleophilia bacterium]
MADQPKQRPDDEELVTVASVWDILEAEMIVGRLEQEGIQATIRAESLSTVMGLTVDGLGRRDVLVRAEDLEQAQRLLEEA